MKKLAVGICSHGNTPPDFSGVLLNLVAETTKAPSPFSFIEVKHKKQCSLLSLGRQQILDECIGGDYTHLFFLDDDMVCPPDTIKRLHARGKRCIGVNSLRKDPQRLTYTAKFAGGEQVKSKGLKGIEEVGGVGLAMFFLDLDAVRKIPKPHFEVIWNEELKTYKGEDYYFQQKLKNSGEKIFIDHELSNECGHIGQFVYSYSMYG